MQVEEGEETLLVTVVDETYGVTDDDAWEAAREAFRLRLEAEFGIPFEDANIGPGADVPAFAALINMATQQVWPVLLAALFLGKPLKENLAAWYDMARKLKSFLMRSVYFNRKGASVLAVDAVLKEIGGLPESIRLLGYRPTPLGESEDLETLVVAPEISDGLPTLYLGFVTHVFEFDVDGVVYRAQIDGKKATVLRVGRTTAEDGATGFKQ